MLGNKEVMAHNIKMYMERDKRTAVEVCNALGIKQNTFSNWVNAKIYPRIDKIEMMADYFHVSKSDLVEDHRFYDRMSAYALAFTHLKTERQLEDAATLYQLYEKASPEAKKAVEVLLKFEPPQA